MYVKLNVMHNLSAFMHVYIYICMYTVMYLSVKKLLYIPISDFKYTILHSTMIHIEISETF